MALTSGDRLGPYQIVSPIGAGGMGEVYKAVDTRLDRTVAIKVLPSEKSWDAESKLRFLHEAKAASALNHPNIVTIYDIGSEGGIDYLAMEFISGKTLDQLIPRNGMRLSELLRVAAQTADALSKAHQAGIIHRDLKPSNIMVSNDGFVKVLDFGLAKRTEPSRRESDATQTIQPLTGDGAVVGTTYYMSPEQAEAKAVDARSDIFSFGAMLYEMATGQRPFTGGSQVAVLSSILREDPKSPKILRDEIPAELARMITRCLRKDPARRFQGMADLKVALEELKEESDSGKLEVSPIAPLSAKGGRPRSLWLAALAIMAVASGLAFWRYVVPTAPASNVALQVTPLTSYPGREDFPSFSPDGNQVAFTWNGPKEDNFDIYVKLIGPGEPLRLTSDPARDTMPKWSPDGRSIAFVRMEAADDRFSIFVIPALGGPERRIGDFISRASDVGFAMPAMCWTSDSKALIVAASETPKTPNRLMVVPLDGGASRPLTNPDADLLGDTRPAMSEDGSGLGFLRSNSSVSKGFFQALSPRMEPEGGPTEINLGSDTSRISGMAWIPGGQEVVVSAGVSLASTTLYRVSTRKAGTARVLQEAGNGATSPAVSAQGHRLAYAVGMPDANIWSVDLTTNTIEMDRQLSSSVRDVFPQFSPDGKRVAFYSNRSGSFQVWIANVDGSQAQAVTAMAGPVTGSPRWSPDGRQITFDSNAGGDYKVYAMHADGGQPRLVSPDTPAFSANWSRDGRSIYFASRRTGEYQIWKAPAQGGAQVQVTHGGGIGPIESLDGKTLYFAKESGAGGLWKMPVDGGEETQVIAELYRYNYAVTGKGIYFVPRLGQDGKASIQFLNFATGATTQIVKLQKSVDLGITVSPDGRTLLYSQIDGTGRDLMLIENFR